MVLLPNAPSCVLVTLSGTNLTTRWQNKLHFTYPTGYTATLADMTNLGNGVIAAWNSDIAPLCNIGVTLINAQTTDLNSRTGPISSITPVSPPVGTRVGTAMTAQVALVASWVIQNRYRGGHARTYWPGGILSDTNNLHLWNTTFVTTANAGFTAFISAVNGIAVSTGHFAFVMLSYFSGSHKIPGQPPPPPVLRPVPTPFAIVGSVVHQRIDTQRRRLGKEVP